MKKIITLLFTLSILLASEDLFAIAQGEFKVGLLMGNTVPMGELSSEGAAIAYGLSFGYMFTDLLLFEIDGISRTSKNLTHTNLSTLINWYYYSNGSVYFDLLGGMALVSNSVKSGSESLSGNGVAMTIGLGIDFDLSSHFLAGFQVRYNYAPPTKTTSSLGTEVPVLDSFSSMLTRILFSF